MENTMQNKSIFFAQHYGQYVLKFRNDQSVNNSVDTNVLGFLNTNIRKAFLELKPLSSLTDKDASDLARIALYHPTIEDYCADDVWIGDGDFNPNGDHWFEVGMRCWEGSLIINDQTGCICLKDEDDKHDPVYNTMGCVDFLRSKGYALPYLGLSVKKLEELGWIKLTV